MVYRHMHNAASCWPRKTFVTAGFILIHHKTFDQQAKLIIHKRDILHKGRSSRQRRVISVIADGLMLKGVMSHERPNVVAVLLAWGSISEGQSDIFMDVPTETCVTGLQAQRSVASTAMASHVMMVAILALFSLFMVQQSTALQTAEALEVPQARRLQQLLSPVTNGLVGVKSRLSCLFRWLYFSKFFWLPRHGFQLPP